MLVFFRHEAISLNRQSKWWTIRSIPMRAGGNRCPLRYLPLLALGEAIPPEHRSNNHKSQVDEHWKGDDGAGMPYADKASGEFGLVAHLP